MSSLRDPLLHLLKVVYGLIKKFRCYNSKKLFLSMSYPLPFLAFIVGFWVSS